MKYIMFEVTNHETGVVRRIPIVFPKELIHAEVAKALERTVIRSMPRMSEVKVLSAGSADVEASGCYGKSESLNRVSLLDEDKDLINKYYATHGIVKIADPK